MAGARAAFRSALHSYRSGTVATRFWSVLANKLTGCRAFGARTIEALDFGVGGYGSAQELITLRTQVWKYDPDMVLLAFYPGNDVLNNERTINPNNGDEAPYFIERNGTLVIDGTHMSPLRWVVGDGDVSVPGDDALGVLEGAEGVVVGDDSVVLVGQGVRPEPLSHSALAHEPGAAVR